MKILAVIIGILLAVVAYFGFVAKLGDNAVDIEQARAVIEAARSAQDAAKAAQIAAGGLSAVSMINAITLMLFVLLLVILVILAAYLVFARKHSEQPKWVPGPNAQFKRTNVRTLPGPPPQLTSGQPGGQWVYMPGAPAQAQPQPPQQVVYYVDAQAEEDVEW